MPILATNNSKPRELIPAGNYLARCYQMIELGTIVETINGKTSENPKVRIGWELPTELKVFNPDRGAQPLVIDQEYNLYMNEKANLRKMLASWRSKDFAEEEAKNFDISKLLGVPCMLNIIHKPKKSDPSSFYQTIAGITAVPRGVVVPPAINKPCILSFDNFDYDIYNMLPDFVKKIIQTSEEYKKLHNPASTNMPNNDFDEINAEHAGIGEPQDDLPF